MKLCRIGELGNEKSAIIDEDNNYRDLSSIIPDFNPDTLNFNTIEKSINNFNETFDRHLQDVKFKNNEEYRMFYNLVKNMLNLSYKERWSALNCINFLNTNINN